MTPLPLPLERLRLSLGRRFLGLGKPKDAAWWDRSYAAGTWDGLHSEQEAARLRVVTSYLERHRPPSSPILDVGCGSAPLYALLPPEAARCWVGSDLSEEALARARSRVPEGTPLLAESAEGDVPAAIVARGPFGAILFNEILYYLRDPVRTLVLYGEQLMPGGCIVISLWNPPRHRVLRWRFARRFETLESTTVSPVGCCPWIVSAVRPRLTGS